MENRSGVWLAERCVDLLLALRPVAKLSGSVLLGVRCMAGDSDRVCRSERNHEHSPTLSVLSPAVCMGGQQAVLKSGAWMDFVDLSCDISLSC